MILTDEIKEYAYDVGFAKFGVTGMNSLDLFEKTLKERDNDYAPWSLRYFLTDPKKLYPDGKSIIILAYDYATVDFPKELQSLVGKAYQARCYVPREDSICGARLKLFTDFLKSKGVHYKEIRYEVPLRMLGMHSGVCDIGKNTFAYVKGTGSFIILHGYIVDTELELTVPEKNSRCPENCCKCIEACPTGAICEPFKITPDKCVGFNNWMRRENEGRFSYIIPRELRSKLGTKIHGCDVCQDVCPRNKMKVDGKFPKDALLEILKEELTLKAILRMEDGYYERYIRPAMYNYINKKMLFQRNAAVAMANTKNTEYIPELIHALDHPEECVRLHVAWALGQFRDSKARKALENKFALESSDIVKDEMRFVLQGQTPHFHDLRP